MTKPKILGITQARYSSSRLPGKVLLKIGNDSLLAIHLKRLKCSKLLDQIVCATTIEPESSAITDICRSEDISYFQGSLNDVLDRFYQTAKIFNADIIVRLTSDCPLIDWDYVDHLVKEFLSLKIDYASNCIVPNLPDGMDAEVFTFEALETAWKNAHLQSEREHVTPYIWKNSNLKNGHQFQARAVNYGKSLNHYRLTVDQIEDFKLIESIVHSIGQSASLDTIIDFLDSNPNLLDLNSNITPNEGYIRSLRKDET